jgi:large subunit ribosomal protein L13
MKAPTSTLRREHEIQEKWYQIDATGLVLGRLAARVAKLVRGKTRPDYSPHLNPKIHVVITNADKVVLTGPKLTDKVYRHHTIYRTGLKEETAGKLLARKPAEVLRRAIQGMLPKNRLGRTLNKNLRIYGAGEYTGQHVAQQPETLVIKTRVPKSND